jgi:hypothetical protein
MRINKSKYTFHAKEMEFLNYIIGLNGIKMDLKKNTDGIRLTNTTKRDRSLKIHKIREFLSTIH